jgi:RNA polymerase sigma-70 factor, ECF subfamily
MDERATRIEPVSRDPSRPSSEVARSRAIADIPCERLVALTAKRDEQAFAELYDRYGRRAYALAYRVLRNREFAEDAVQEAFLGLWRSAGRFRPERGTPQTFLLTLVHRRAVDRVRSERRRSTEHLNEHKQPRASGYELETSFERERVAAALRCLPHRCREAIELAYYDGYTQSEIASRLNVPHGTIKSRTAHGLSKLARLLSDPNNSREVAPAQPALRRVAEA